MRAHLVVVVLLMLLVAFAGEAREDAKQDAAQLDQIIAQVDELLPAGWSVAFEVQNDHCGRSRPVLVISSTEVLPVEYMGPGKSGDPAIDTTKKKVTVELTFVPYMTPEDRAKTLKHNEELDQQRRQFEETRLGQQQSRYKGGFTPTTYQWQTGDKSPIIREYALFWLNTEPQELPTHRCGTFSISTYDLDPSTNPMEIHDDRRAKEFAQILDGLKKIFVPYETTR